MVTIILWRRISVYCCPSSLVLPLPKRGKHAFVAPPHGATACQYLYLLFPWGIGGFISLGDRTIAFVIWRTKGRKRVIYGSVALGVITVMAIAALQNPRVQQIIQIDTSQGVIPTIDFQVDGQTEDRIFMWQAGFNILRDRPLTGVGLGNMSRLYNFYRPINAGAGAAHIQQLHGTPAHLLGELGLIGGLAIAFLLVQLVRLGWRIHSLTEDLTARRLLYGLGGGWFAYAMAALTDYQLENIPISLTLAFTVLALLAIADRTLPNQIPASLSESQRRSLSLSSLGATLSALVAALPFSISMGFFAQGQLLWAQGNAEQAFEKIAIAETINAWNPVYPLRLGLWLLETREFQQDQPEQYRKSTELAVAYFQDAWTMAPNDFYFNMNVAVLLIELDSPLANHYLERAVQLLPRESGFAYLLLGYAYAQQDRKEARSPP
ncbi:MAG: O-antigen ligase family protein [Limnothrix sp. RL_2_0]|nr:O-antigen ligase family protein [Limnothrix sp. RL_2_0]